MLISAGAATFSTLDLGIAGIDSGAKTYMRKIDQRIMGWSVRRAVARTGWLDTVYGFGLLPERLTYARHCFTRSTTRLLRWEKP